MSTATTTPTAPDDVLDASDVSATPRVPFTRLIGVELRKAFDTRASRWFIAAIIILCLIVVATYALTAPGAQQGLDRTLAVSSAVLAYFLPVLVIVLMTCEWSQRTGLVTFTLEPHRSRVVGAKLGAALVLGALLIAAAFAIAVIGTLISGSGWAVEANTVINRLIVINLIGILTGVAIGMLVMSSPAAIVAYFIYTLVLPVAVGALYAFQHWFADLAPWIEFNTAQQPLFQGDYVPSGDEVAQLITSGLIWLVLPFAIGLLRLMRTEPR